MVKRKIDSILRKVSTLFVFYLALSSVYPPIRALSGYTLFSLIAMFGWIIIAGLGNPVFFTVFSKRGFYTQLTIIFIVYTFFVSYFFENGIIGNRYLVNSQVFIFYLIYRYNKHYGYDSSSRLVVKWTLPFIVISSISTIRGLIDNPQLSRSIKSSGELSDAIQAQGIGGYPFIYFLMFIIIILTYLILNREKLKISKKQIFIVYLLLGLFTLAVVYSNFFTAFILITAAIFFLLLLRKTSTLTKVFYSFTGIILLVSWKQIFMNITNWLIMNLNYGKTLNRVIDLRNQVLGNNTGTSLIDGRIPVWEVSWDVFLNNPLFGVITERGNALFSFGQHSEILDTFALFGLGIGIINIILITYPFFEMMRKPSILFSLNVTMFIIVLIFLSVNITAPSIGYAVFFVYPVVSDWVIENVTSNVTSNVPLMQTAR